MHPMTNFLFNDQDCVSLTTEVSSLVTLECDQFQLLTSIWHINQAAQYLNQATKYLSEQMGRNKLRNLNEDHTNPSDLTVPT